jgi:WD40 repeat protein
MGQPPARQYELEMQAGRIVTYSADGKLVAVGGSGPSLKAGELPNGIVQILDVATGRTLARHAFSGRRESAMGRSDHRNSVTALRFFRDGQRLTVCDELGAYIWDLEGNRVDTITEPRIFGVRSIALSRSAKLLATSENVDIVLRDANSLKIVRTLSARSGAAVDFSHDDALLASAEGNNRVALWDVASGRRLAEAHAMMGPLYDVAFAPDDQSIAAVGEGGAKVWTIAIREGRPALVLRHTLVGHIAAVLFVDYSEDGKLIVTSSNDRSIKIWDAATSQQKAAILLPFRSGEAALAPGGQWLATAGFSSSDQKRAVPLLMIWKLADLLDPRAVEARAKAAVEELFRLARAGPPDAAFRQLAALGPAPGTTVPLLVEGLKSADEPTRRLSMAALGLQGPWAKAAIPEIRKRAREDPRLELPAREALQRIEEPSR